MPALSSTLSTADLPAFQRRAELTTSHVQDLSICCTSGPDLTGCPLPPALLPQGFEKRIAGTSGASRTSPTISLTPDASTLARHQDQVKRYHGNYAPWQFGTETKQLTGCGDHNHLAIFLNLDESAFVLV